MIFWIRLWTLILQRRFFDLILPCFKIGLSQICFSKIGLRAWVTDFLDQPVNIYFQKNIDFFVASKIDYLKLDISKIGLRPWVNDFFGSNCELVILQKRFFDLIFLASKLDYLKFVFRKLDWSHGKCFFGSSCELYSTTFFLIGCSVLQNWIISNLICPKLDCGHE